MNLDKQDYYLDCLDLLVIQDHISFWGNMKRTLKAVPHDVYTVYTNSFFVNFLLLLILLETLKCPFLDMYPEPDNSYLAMHTDHVYITPTLSTTVNTMFILIL